MAQLSPLSKLLAKVAYALSDDDVKNLRVIVVRDKFLSRAKVVDATAMEIFDMLEDNMAIGTGNLGYLVQILSLFHKRRLAEEVERFDQEQKKGQGAAGQSTAGVQPVQGDRLSYNASKAVQVEQAASLKTSRQPEDSHFTQNTRIGRVRTAPPRVGRRTVGTAQSTGVTQLKVSMQSKETTQTTGTTQSTGIIQSKETMQSRRSTKSPGTTQSKGTTQLTATSRSTAAIQSIGTTQSTGITQPTAATQSTAANQSKGTTQSTETTQSTAATQPVGNSQSTGTAQSTATTQSNGSTQSTATDESKRTIQSTAISQSTATAQSTGITRSTTTSQPPGTTQSKGTTQSTTITSQSIGTLQSAGNSQSKGTRQSAGNGQSGNAPGDRDPLTSLKVLLTEVNTRAVQGDKTRQFDLYCQIGDLYRTELYNITALKYYQKMLECSRALSEHTKRSKAYIRLGLTYQMLQKPQEAFQHHVKALEVHGVTLENDTEICAAYKNVASSLAKSGQVSDANDYYETALSVAMETGNKTEQINIYFKLGDLYRIKLHEPLVSHMYYTEMLALARDVERKDLERLAYNRLALACDDMEDNEAALEWHQKHLKMSQDNEDRKAQIAAHTNVGNAYGLVGRLDEAIYHFKSALQMAQQAGDQYGQMMVYLMMGDMHREQLLSPQTSIQYYEQHLALARQLVDRHQESVAYNRLGLAHDEMDNSLAALEWHQKYLKMSQESEDKNAQITAHENMAASYKALGKLDLARAHKQSAKDIVMETGTTKK